ncbi:Piso0_000318 [Millerozyma farinosa CBS 7064]|uniref:Piso0_000318 protein n=1 Tax=Pichia sorbitophila (strain ATCC MYA-4447 / BCRC 22081 / CBS 7064 / NBRC 10061 / NRRL Y-12695) TaxID=559304 RepID=G8YTN6_PICSO|nr:Piso0_000318 [Millerozyma farinosa CBS 7064]
MDRQSSELLTSRIEQIELVLSDNDGNPSRSCPIMARVKKLQKQVDQMTRELSNFKLLEKVLDKPESSGEPSMDSENSFRKDVPSNDEIRDPKLNLEAKKELLRSKSSMLNTAVDNLTQLSNIEFDFLINFHDSPSFNSFEPSKIINRLMMHEIEIKDKTNKYYILLLKNMVVYERYINLALSEIEFWAQVEERLVHINRHTVQLESDSRSKHLY